MKFSEPKMLDEETRRALIHFILEFWAVADPTKLDKLDEENETEESKED